MSYVQVRHWIEISKKNISLCGRICKFLEKNNHYCSRAYCALFGFIDIDESTSKPKRAQKCIDNTYEELD